MKEWFKARNIWGAAIMTLSDAEAGRFAKALWQYTMTGEAPEVTGNEKGVFAIALMTLGLDDQEGLTLSEKRAAAGSIGGKQKVANQFANIANEANEANATNKNKNKEEEEDKEKEKTPYGVKKMCAARFDRFWMAYPRKQDKAKALKAFERINPNDSMLDTMLNALEAQKRSDQWTRDGGQYIPHPTTWLNGMRWEDEVQTAQRPVKKPIAAQYSQREYTEKELEQLADDPVIAMLEGTA